MARARHEFRKGWLLLLLALATLAVLLPLTAAKGPKHHIKVTTAHHSKTKHHQHEDKEHHHHHDHEHDHDTQHHHDSRREPDSHRQRGSHRERDSHRHRARRESEEESTSAVPYSNQHDRTRRARRDPEEESPPVPYSSNQAPHQHQQPALLPTSQDYDRSNPESPVPFSQWLKCRGPFALCSMANCSMVESSGSDDVPMLAACGCLLPPADTARPAFYVAPNLIKSSSVYQATVDECFDGQDPASDQAGAGNNNSSCTRTGSAPVCRAINAQSMYDRGAWPLVSAFSIHPDQGVQTCIGADDDSSLVADCMTAACYKQRAFDGSPVTCFCPVYSVPAGDEFVLGFRRSRFPHGDGIPCQPQEGFVSSGA